MVESTREREYAGILGYICARAIARHETTPHPLPVIVIHTPVEPQRRERNDGSPVIIIRILMGEVEMACAFDADALRIPIVMCVCIALSSFTFCLDTPLTHSLYVLMLHSLTHSVALCAFKHIGDSK